MGRWDPLARPEEDVLKLSSRFDIAGARSSDYYSMLEVAEGLAKMEHDRRHQLPDK